MSIRVEPCWFHCKECQARIVLLDYEMNCPKCGRKIPNLPKDEALFAENAIFTMSYYKEDHGMYRPLAFYICDIGYELLSLTYSFFDFLEQKKPENNEAFLDKYIQDARVEDEERDGYMRKHFREGIAQVLAVYENQGFEKYIEDNKVARMTRVKLPQIDPADMEKIEKQKWLAKLRAKYLT